MLSTISTGLSTVLKDNFPRLTSTFTAYPQKTTTPITTTFIYTYLSPQANLWGETTHSAYQPNCVKLSNLRVKEITIDTRASA